MYCKYLLKRQKNYKPIWWCKIKKQQVILPCYENCSGLILKTNKPIKKVSNKRITQNTKSIMPKDDLWSTEKFTGSHKHHIFGGANRELSEEDGLFIYLTPEMHNMSDKGIHFNKTFMEYAHSIGQLSYMQYYNKTKEEFIARYGKNYL
jgi:hypothetical protein